MMNDEQNINTGNVIGGDGSHIEIGTTKNYYGSVHESEKKKPSVFISYARKDATDFAKRLLADLEAQDIDAWLDKRDMLSGDTFINEIGHAIEDADYFLLVYTPGARESKFCQDEWKKALEQCKPIIPLLLVGTYEDLPQEANIYLNDAPDFTTETNYESSLEKLLHQINKHPRLAGELKNAPNIVPHYVPRPELLNGLVKDLTRHKTEVLVKPILGVGIHGLSGVGKSTIASAISRNYSVCRTFKDGVIWLKLGASITNDNLKEKWSELAELLGYSGQTFETDGSAKRFFERITYGKEILLILDDVWQLNHAQSFKLGDRSRLLVTSRNAKLLVELGLQTHKIDLLSDEQARQLLANASGLEVDTLPPIADAILKECHNLALSLAMIGQQVRGKPENRWDTVLTKLQDADLEKISANFADEYEHPSLFRAIKVSVDALDTDFDAGDDSKTIQRQLSDLYADFCIFKEDTSISESVLITLWKPIDVVESIEKLIERNLIERVSKNTFAIHDAQLKYLRKLKGDAIIQLHEKLLSQYNPHGQSWDQYEFLDDGYIVDNIIYHLEQAGREREIHELFCSKNWVALRAKNSFIGLLNDFEKARRMVTPENDIATYLRYKLFADVVKQRYRNFPVEVLLVALKKRLASPERLLTDVESMDGDDEAKVRMYIEAYKLDVVPAGLRKEFSERILAITSRIYDEDKKIIILRDLIPVLHNDIKPDAQQMLWQAIFRVKPLEKNDDEPWWLKKPAWPFQPIGDQNKAREWFEKHSAILNQLFEELTPEQIKLLEEDALRIDDAYHRIMVLIIIYNKFAERNLEQVLYDNFPEVDNSFDGSMLFSFIVSRLPKDLQIKISKEILRILIIFGAKFRWEDGEFYTQMLHPLVPLVPSQDIPALWEYAQYEARRDGGWGTRSLIEIALLVSADNIPDDFHFENDFAKFGDEFDPIVMACIKWALAYRLPLEGQIQVAVDAWNVIWLYPRSVHPYAQDRVSKFVEKLPQKVVIELWNATLALYQEEHDKKQLERHFSDSFKRIDYPGKMLTILATNLPADFIQTACMQCGTSHVRSVLKHWKEFSWLDVVALLMDHVESTEDKSIIYKDLLTITLKEPVNYGYDTIDIGNAVKIISLMPETLQEESWDKVLNTAYSIPDLRTRVYGLVETLETVPTKWRSKVWFDTWEIAINFNDKDLLLTVIGNFKNVYSHLSSEHFAVISDFDWMNSWWSNSIIDKAIEARPHFLRDQAEGVALFMQFASIDFKVKMWTVMRVSDLNLYLFAVIFPAISESDRTTIFEEMMRYSPKNIEYTSFKALLNHWADENIWQIWNHIYEVIGEFEKGLRWSAIEWITFFTPFLSNTYCIKAWEKHIPNQKYTDGFWADIAIQLAKQLPSEALPNAWIQVNEYAYSKREIKSAIAPRLPEDFIEKLAEREEISLLQLPAGIFTCSLTEYIRHGGPWLALDWKVEDKEIIVEPWLVDYQYDDDYGQKRQEHQIEVGNFLKRYAYLSNLTVPIAYMFLIIVQLSKWALKLRDQASDIIAKTVKLYILWRISMLPVTLVLFPFILPLIILVYMYQWLEERSKNGSPFWERIFRLLTILFNNQIAYYHYSYLFNRKVARSELVDTKDIVNLATKRPLLQIVGGRKLRKSVQESYKNAYGWWRDSLKWERTDKKV